MPTTRTITTYTYNELSKKAQEKARDWWRTGDRDMFDFYAENVIDDAKELGKLMGIDISNVYYSGFWSQGDGACFEGDWDASRTNAKGLIEYAPQDETLHKIANTLQSIADQFPFASLSVKHEGHYSHEYETRFSIGIVDEEANEIDTPEAEQAEKTLIETCRDFMRWIYKTLESEYEYMNSDEQVAETIIENGYEFTEDGKRSVIL